MSSVSAEGSSQKELKTGSRSSQEVPCGHAEIELEMSVTIRREAFKSHSDVDCKVVLEEIVSQATKNRHNVSITDLEGTWKLKGCFCGIKEIRTELQNKIRKKQSEENSGKPLSGEGGMELKTDQQSHQENDKMGSKDLSDIKPKAPMNNSALLKAESEQSEAGNRSTNKSRNNEKLDFQQRNPIGESNVKSGAEDSNSENSNNAKTEKKGQRTLFENSTGGKIIKMEVANSGFSEGRDVSQMEGKSKDGKSSENLKQQAIYPVLSTVKNNEHSECQSTFIGKNQEVKLIRNENKGVTNSCQSERRDDSEREGTSKDSKYAEHPKQQDVKVIKNLNKGVANSHNLERPDDLKKEGASKDLRFAENPKQQVRHQDLPTSKNDDYKRNLRHDAKYPDPTNSTGLQENQATDPEPDRICALMLLPSVDIDEDIFYFLKRHRIHELYRISDKCNLFEQYTVGKKHKLALDVRNYHDTDSVTAEFRKLYSQITFDNVKIPEGIDPDSLKSLVEPMAEFKDVELRFISQERVCKIVGSYREMDRAKEMLIDVIDSNEPTRHGFDTTANNEVRLNIQIPATPTHKEPAKTVQLYIATAAINTSQAGMSVYTVLNHSHDSLLLYVSNSLTIDVKHGDLTKMSDTDVVVSCINNYLDVDGFAADEIMKAAGPHVKTELLKYKSRLSSLPTGCLVDTSAGHLGGNGVKAIIHVVRPQDHRSTDDLRIVFTNCLSHTNDVLRMKSICLPPIGHLLYGAEMVVDCFLDAVELFASTVANGNPSAAAQHQPNTHHLNCIRLVTNDHHCIQHLVHCIRRRLGAH